MAIQFDYTAQTDFGPVSVVGAILKVQGFSGGRQGYSSGSYVVYAPGTQKIVASGAIEFETIADDRNIVQQSYDAILTRIASDRAAAAEDETFTSFWAEVTNVESI